MSESVASFPVSWRTDSVARSCPPSLCCSRNGHATQSRRTMNVESARNSGMRFPSWREPKPLRVASRPGTAQDQTSNASRMRIPVVKKSMDTQPFHDTQVHSMVNRLSAPTLAAKLKTIKFNKRVHMVDNNYYSWSNMAVYKDHQKTLYTDGGGIKRSFKSGSKR